jgi:transposase
MDYETIGGIGSRIFLPGREGHVGGTAADNRLFVEAVLYRYRGDVPWRDLPERFGDLKNTHKRLRRWCESSVFERIFTHLAADHDNEYMMIDSTIVLTGASDPRKDGLALGY